jgi:hypothetical protein
MSPQQPTENPSALLPRLLRAPRAAPGRGKPGEKSRRAIGVYALGAAPLLALVAAFGLLLIASADNGARLEEVGS